MAPFFPTFEAVKPLKKSSVHQPEMGYFLFFGGLDQAFLRPDIFDNKKLKTRSSKLS